jgi:hypothetical protein
LPGKWCRHATFRKTERPATPAAPRPHCG